MIFGFLIPIIVLVAIVIGVTALVRRGTGRGGPPSTGVDLIAYLLLAVAMGTAVFSLARLGQAAFPGGSFVFDPERQVAASLAGLVVAGPIAVYLWRRQSARRVTYPGSAGWTTYLSLTEALFTSFLVFTLFNLLEWAFGENGAPPLTDLVVYGGIFVFHELAIRRTPPASEAAELPRILGSAVGLVPFLVGLGGLLDWALRELYSTLAASVGSGIPPGTSAALLLSGLAIWWYRWLRPWPGAPGAPRNAWTFLTSTFGLLTLLGAATYTLAESLAFVLSETTSAGTHFDFLPVSLSSGIVGAMAWAHHRRRLGSERTDPVRAYEYLTMAFALSAAVGSATTLVAFVFDRRDLVGATGSAVITVGTVLVAALLTWARFWVRSEAAPRPLEAASAPRRFYLLGLGVIGGLVAAGALIATLVFVFQRLLGVGDETGSVTGLAALFVFAGGTAWHLIRTYVSDRDLLGTERVVKPFDVTLICSHPGMISTRFPKEARIRVIHRGDDDAVIDDDLAERIVEAVGSRSSLVWVEEGDFRIAPAR